MLVFGIYNLLIMWKVLFISSECSLYPSAGTNSEKYVMELITLFAGMRLLLLGQ